VPTYKYVRLGFSGDLILPNQVKELLEDPRTNASSRCPRVIHGVAGIHTPNEILAAAQRQVVRKQNQSLANVDIIRTALWVFAK